MSKSLYLRFNPGTNDNLLKYEQNDYTIYYDKFYFLLDNGTFYYMVDKSFYISYSKQEKDEIILNHNMYMKRLKTSNILLTNKYIVKVLYITKLEDYMYDQVQFLNDFTNYRNYIPYLIFDDNLNVNMCIHGIPLCIYMYHDTTLLSKLLLRDDVNVNVTDKLGNTLLSLAVLHNKQKLFDLLIDDIRIDKNVNVCESSQTKYNIIEYCLSLANKSNCYKYYLENLLKKIDVYTDKVNELLNTDLFAKYKPMFNNLAT